MSNVTWRDLFVETVRTPQNAAQIVKSVAMPRQQIWMGIVAVAALNALFSSIINDVLPAPSNTGSEIPVLNIAPLPKAVVIGGILVLLAHMLTWTGRAMGGKGQVDDFMKLLVWMQIVGITLQVCSVLVILAVPLVGSILALLMIFVLLRILLSFVKVGHEMSSMFNAGLVVFASCVGMLIGLSILLTLSGVSSLGVQPNV